MDRILPGEAIQGMIDATGNKDFQIIKQPLKTRDRFKGRDTLNYIWSLNNDCQIVGI